MTRQLTHVLAITLLSLCLSVAVAKPLVEDVDRVCDFPSKSIVRDPSTKDSLTTEEFRRLRNLLDGEISDAELDEATKELDRLSRSLLLGDAFERNEISSLLLALASKQRYRDRLAEAEEIYVLVYRSLSEMDGSPLLLLTSIERLTRVEIDRGKTRCASALAKFMMSSTQKMHDEGTITNGVFEMYEGLYQQLWSELNGV